MGVEVVCPTPEVHEAGVLQLTERLIASCDAVLIDREKLPCSEEEAFEAEMAHVVSPLGVPLTNGETNWVLEGPRERSYRLVLRAELTDAEFSKLPLSRFLPWEVP